MIPDFWKGVPPLGRRGRQWFRRKMWHYACILLAKQGKDPQHSAESADVAAAIVDWFTANIKRYVGWQDEKEYRGRGYAFGQWAMICDKVEADFPAALRECEPRIRAEHEAARYPTLDAWLDAERQGRVAASSHAEPYAVTFVPEAHRPAYFDRLHRMHRTWPRACGSCGAEFRPERYGGVRCRACRQRAKAARAGGGRSSGKRGET